MQKKWLIPVSFVAMILLVAYSLWIAFIVYFLNAAQKITTQKF